jgi:predicted nucleic acid-binding protein
MTPKAGDVLFVDTNVLLTATDEQRAHHKDALTVLGTAASKGIHLALSGQILREYLVVATRPRPSNGLGLSTADALANVDEFLRCVIVYDETEAVARRLRALVRSAGLSGTRIHDGNVAATMLAHGLTLILTQNAADFEAFAGLAIVTPAEAAQAVETDDSPATPLA